MAARATSVAPLPEAPTIEIDGIGPVPVPHGFHSMPLDQQNALVDQIVATRRGGETAPTDGSGEPAAPSQSTQLQPAGAPVGPDPIDESTRGDILPIGTTESGRFGFAVPRFLHTPIKAFMDVVDGVRTVDQLTPEEKFGMAALAAGVSPAAGSTRAIARAAPAQAPKAAPAEVAAIEAAAPAAAPAAVPAVAPVPVAVAPRPAPPAAPAVTASTTTQELRAASQSFYRQAEEAGVIIDAQAFRPVVQDIAASARKLGLDDTLTPDSVAALRRMQASLGSKGASARGISFEDLEILRRIASDASGAQRGGDRNIAKMLIDKIDDFVAGLGAKDVLAGDGQVAARTIVQARDMWSKVAKLETVERLVQRAADSAPGFSGSGFENALRTEFRALAKNAREMRTYSEEERNAIRTIARGTVTANTARNIGKLAPTGVVSMTLGGGAGAALGAQIGMPVAGAIAVGTVGFIARQLATVLTKRTVGQLETIIKTGGESALARGAIGRGHSLAAQLGAAVRTGATAQAATGR